MDEIKQNLLRTFIIVSLLLPVEDPSILPHIGRDLEPDDARNRENRVLTKEQHILQREKRHFGRAMARVTNFGTNSQNKAIDNNKNHKNEADSTNALPVHSGDAATTTVCIGCIT